MIMRDRECLSETWKNLSPISRDVSYAFILFPGIGINKAKLLTVIEDNVDVEGALEELSKAEVLVIFEDGNELTCNLSSDFANLVKGIVDSQSLI